MNNHKKLQTTLLVSCLLAGSAAALQAGSAAKKPLAGYDTLTVEKFTVASTEATRGFSPRQAEAIRADVIDRLRAGGPFPTVVDPSEEPAAAESANPDPATGTRQLVLCGSVIKFSKGNRAARHFIGLGAGAAAVKVLFVFRDPDTGQDVFRTERQGKFYGTVSAFGGEGSQAVAEASGDVVDGLMKDIKKNR